MKQNRKFWHCLTGWLPILLGVLTVGGLLLGAQPASAQNCISDRFFAATGGHLTCTANDVRIAAVNSVTDLNGNPITQCIAGSTFSFLANFEVLLGAQARYDIGLYFATDADPNGDGALTGTCAVNLLTKAAEVDSNGNPAPQNFINLDPAPDTCGDIDAAHNPQFVRVQINNALCADLNNDGFMDLPNCTSWRQPGSNQVCTSTQDAYPGSPSKCNCGTLQLPVRVETGGLTVTKDASPASLPEPGGEFTYTVTTVNTLSFTSVTLDSICDDKFGTVATVGGTATPCPAGTIGTINSTTCALGTQSAPAVTLTPGDSITPPPAGSFYTCTFKANVTGDPQTVTDTVTVKGHDATTAKTPRQGSDTAQVSITNVPPSAQVIKSLDSLQCAIVRYKVVVKNCDTGEGTTLSSLIDNTFGNIANGGGPLGANVVATTCSVPQPPSILTAATDQTLCNGGSYSCTFDAEFCGSSSHTDHVTATVGDDEGGSINQDSNNVTVNVSAQ